ncbi:hypothetical protein D3C84_1246650 [compost metagenome]
MHVAAAIAHDAAIAGRVGEDRRQHRRRRALSQMLRDHRFDRLRTHERRVAADDDGYAVFFA